MSSIEDIKYAITIYDILDLYKIKYSSKVMEESIRCPFHDDRTASARIYPDINRILCYGACSRSYDVLDIVTKMENISLPEAMKWLSEKFKVASITSGVASRFWSLTAENKNEEKRQTMALIFVMGKSMVPRIRKLSLDAQKKLWRQYDNILEQVRTNEETSQDAIRAWYVNTEQEVK